jgi:uncharacterized membrane protein
VRARLAEVEQLGRAEPSPMKRPVPAPAGSPVANPGSEEARAPLELQSVRFEREREAEDRAAEPGLAGFDRLVGLISYGLLIVSPLLFGAPALASFVLAYAHRGSAQMAVRTHFRFQLRIIFTALLLLALAAAAFAGAAGKLPIQALQVAHDSGLSALVTQARISAWTPVIDNVAALSAWLFLALALIWLVGAPLFGFVRLLAHRSVGRGFGL